MNFFTSRAEPLPHCIFQRYYYYNTSPRFVASVSQNLSCYNVKATPHKDRLTAQHIICLHLFRHLAQFLLAIHTVSRRRHCTIWRKICGASDALSFVRYCLKKSHLFFSSPEIGCGAWVYHFFDAFRVSTICKSRAFSSLCIKPIVIFHTYLRLTIVNIYDIIYDRRIENVTIYSSFSHMTHRESQGASSSDKGNQSFFYSYKTDQDSFLAYFSV